MNQKKEVCKVCDKSPLPLIGAIVITLAFTLLFRGAGTLFGVIISAIAYANCPAIVRAFVEK